MNKLITIFLLLSVSIFAHKKKNRDTYEPKKIIYDNHIYEPYIRTVQLYAAPLNTGKNIQTTLNPPVVNLQNNQPIF